MKQEIINILEHSKQNNLSSEQLALNILSYFEYNCNLIDKDMLNDLLPKDAIKIHENLITVRDISRRKR